MKLILIKTISKNCYTYRLSKTIHQNVLVHSENTKYIHSISNLTLYVFLSTVNSHWHENVLSALFSLNDSSIRYCYSFRDSLLSTRMDVCKKKIRACVCMRSFLDFCAVLLCGSVPLDVLVCEFFSHRKNTIVLTTQTEKEIWNHTAKNNPRILTEMMKKAINQSDCWPKTWRQRKKRS